MHIEQDIERQKDIDLRKYFKITPTKLHFLTKPYLIWSKMFY